MRIGANFSEDTPWDDNFLMSAEQLSTSAAPLGLATGLLLTAALGDSKHAAQYWQLVAGVLGLVVALLLLLLLSCYRQCVRALLFLAHGSRFKGLMPGPDALWCTNDPTSQPIINIVASVQATSGQELMAALRRCLARAVTTYPRLSATRHCSLLGYSYWLHSPLSLEEHVRWLEQTEEPLQQVVSRIANTPLPMDNHSTWEVLVGQHAPSDGEFPVLFRVHHTLGDGVTLVSLLLDTLSTQEKKVDLSETYSASRVDEVDRLKVVSDWGLLRPPDRNCLKNSRLSGDKVVAWLSDPTLFPTIRRIKRSMVGARFTDVVLTAVSASLEHHFRSQGCPVPDNISVAIPARTSSDQNNGFSLGLLSLPIRAASAAERLRTVCRNSAALRSSGQYQLNWLLLNVVGALLPVGLLSQLVGRLPSTLVVSNVLGPATAVSIENLPLTSLVFLVPNRGDTGVGVSVFSYAGRLHLGLMADRALLTSTAQAQKILDRVLAELSILDEALQCPHAR